MITHDRPIPDAQNEITEAALALNPEWIFYVEEDMELPPNILVDMMLTRSPVVTADYSLGPQANYSTEPKMCIVRGKKNEIDYCGMGCLLVNAHVFRKLEKPWFATYQFDGDFVQSGNKRPFGGQDVYFCRKLIDAGIPIVAVGDVCKHYRVKKYNDAHSNNGVHEIVEI